MIEAGPSFDPTHPDTENPEIAESLESDGTEELSLPPADLRTPEDALRWFATNPYAFDYNPAMQQVLGIEAGYAKIREEIYSVLDDWSNSPRDADFLVACNLVDRLSETDLDVARHYVPKLLQKDYFLSQDSQRLKTEAETHDERFARVSELVKADRAAVLIAVAKNHLIQTIDPPNFWFYREEELANAESAIQQALGEILVRFSKLEDGERGSLWRSILLYGTGDQKAEARKRLSETMGQEGEAIRLADESIFDLAADPSEQVSSEATDIIAHHLYGSFGIDYGDCEDFIQSWRKSRGENEISRTIWSNVNRIEFLESQRPGMTNALSGSFGIHDFARYPSPALLWQYDQMKKSDFNYGLLVYPRDDWNGAFYDEKELAELFAQMQPEGNEWGGFVITEADGKLSVIRQMNSIRKQYGSASFGIMAGHGSQDTIQFGNNFDRGGVMRTEDISKMIAISSATRPKREDQENPSPALFKEGSTLILFSCSTGSENGIGSKISELTRGTVIAPTIPTSPKKIEFTAPEVEGGVPSFEVSYQNEGEGAKFQSGQKVETPDQSSETMGNHLVSSDTVDSGNPTPEQKINPNEVCTEIFKKFQDDMHSLRRNHKFDTETDWEVATEDLARFKSEATMKFPEDYHDSIAVLYDVLLEISAQFKLDGPLFSEKTEYFESMKTAAKWQKDCVTMIRQFENLDYGKHLVAAVRLYLPHLAQQYYNCMGLGANTGAARALETLSGVRGMRLSEDVLRYVLEGTGAKLRATTVDEDVEGGTDFVLDFQNRRYAVQVKSKQDNRGSITCELVSSFQPTTELDDNLTRQKLKAQNDALHRAREMKIANDLLWVQVSSSGKKQIDGLLTGKATQDYLGSQKLGEFGAKIREILGMS
jgi:hypothetical protein